LKVIDSSGWLEFFTDGPLADEYAAHLDELSEVLVPTIVFFEVYKRIKRERSEEEALVAVSQLRKARVIPISEILALKAADLSLEHKLAMADALVYATALVHDATLFTCDSDFEAIPGVQYRKKPGKS
jgi:predicted nucleic acid-binding protein